MRRRWSIVAVVVVVAATLALVIRPPLKNPAYEHDLIAMRRDVDDQAITFPIGNGNFSPADLPTDLQQRYTDQAQQDKQHEDRLSALFDRYGWPTDKMVGREAQDAAIFLVDRSPDVAFKQRALDLIRHSGAPHTTEYALLVDLVAFQTRQPQTYGTQWACEDGQLHYLTPLKDEAHLAQLRLSVGLPPAEKFFADVCSGNRPPTFRLRRRGPG